MSRDASGDRTDAGRADGAAARDWLHLTRLHLRRAPGIADGLTLDRLSSQVNVVFGPNGSGKTTTAAAIEAALWPESARGSRALLDAHFTLAGASWSVRLDAGKLRVQRDGHDVAHPTPRRADLRHRYRLHLHELLLSEHRGADFAAEVRLAGEGGWDVPGAAGQLDFLARAPKGSRESSALSEARRRLAGAQGVERELQREAERLGELEAELEGAREARRRVALMDAAITHARRREEYRDASAALAGYDPRMASLSGDELDRIGALDARAAEAARRAEEARDARAAAQARMDEALPSGPLPDTLLSVARTRLGTLGELHRGAELAEKSLAGAAAACEDARRAMGDGVREERLADVDVDAIGDLSGWAMEAGRLGAERVIRERERDAIEVSEPPYPPEILARGAAALEGWLTSPDPAAEGGSRSRAFAVAAAILAMAAAVLLGVIARESAIVLAAAGVIGLAAIPMLVLAIRRTAPPTGQRTGHAAAYAALPLPQPEGWNAPAVNALLHRLRDHVSEAREAARDRDRRNAAEQRLRELEPGLAESERRRVALCDRLGLGPATDASSIHWLVGRIGRWRDARVTLATAHAELMAVRERQVAGRDALRAILAPYTPLPDDADEAELRGAVEALEWRDRAHTEAGAEARDAGRVVETATSELARCAEERRALLQRVGIGEDEVALLTDWTASRTGFLAARQRETVALAQLQAVRATLESMPGFDVPTLEMPETVLQEERAAAEREAAGLEPLLERMHAIRQDVDRARSGSSVADALDAVGHATHALASACERDEDAAVGAVLVRHVQDATRDQQRPRVFHRAREIFLAITHHRWRLDLDEGDEPAFRALDTHDGVGHALHELSSATRMQLLVAVRLAFVEVQERDHGGPRLPLLLDETLGTCDDARARAMMETAAMLARDGRQLFYFTAQWDEVERWEAAMREHGVDVALHQLHELRAGARLHVERPEWAALPRPALPTPDGMTREEYGRALRVHAISRTEPSIGGVHLWHLVDDLPLLHHLLSLPVTTWGELESFVEYGGGALLARHGDAWPRIRAAARALEAAHTASRVGHGLPVDRQVLVDSGTVSDRFIDTVSELAREFGGDAARLVEHLASGQVRHFRADAVERLREYLAAHGQLCDEAPLGHEEIVRRVMAAAAAEIDSRLLSLEQLRRIVAAMLPSGAAGGELRVAHPGLAASAARITPAADSDQR